MINGKSLLVKKSALLGRIKLLVDEKERIKTAKLKRGYLWEVDLISKKLIDSSGTFAKNNFLTISLGIQLVFVIIQASHTITLQL